jgi:hypothetical protein
MTHTMQQTKRTEWNIHPRKKYSEFNFSQPPSNKGKNGTETDPEHANFARLAVGNETN